ncbi:MAG: hypothetical protein U5L06_00580 [Rhodovibrio sp.]|nr:hypothetical protein [Rhodovibrio sp.]
MKRGTKPTPSAQKQQRGTDQPVREAQRTEITVPHQTPSMPDFIQADSHAVCVWEEDLPRAMAAGAVDADSSEFAAYCALEASIRKAFEAGEAPPAAYLIEARRKRELFNLAGPKSRVVPAGSDGQGNPFRRNGAKNRKG